MKALALSAGFLASNSKGGRLAAVVVAAVAASAPGESDDELPSSEDCEVTYILVTVQSCDALHRSCLCRSST